VQLHKLLKLVLQISHLNFFFKTGPRFFKLHKMADQSNMNSKFN